MSAPTASERRLAAQIRAHVSWAKTQDRPARTAAARAALDKKFLDEADGDPVRAEHLRRAYYLKLAYKSAQQSRRKNAVDRKAGETCREIDERAPVG